LYAQTLNQGHEAPVLMTHPEEWQWRVLYEALKTDPGFTFFFRDRLNEENLMRFFEAVVRGTLESGCGSVFASPDRRAVLVWRWFGAELPEERTQQMHSALGQEGVERYRWFRQATDVPVDPADRPMTMRPNYIGVLPGMQGRGYGSHLLKWTLEHFDRQGFITPFLVASTRRSAKLYGPLLGFYSYREVCVGPGGQEPAVVVMKRIGGGRPNGAYEVQRNGMAEALRTQRAQGD
jgi:GNAT superfamily N-acetyltransferase